MFSFGVPQGIVAGYILIVAIGAPILRTVMMRRNGAKDFVPWKQFWGTWSVDVALKTALVGLLYWGGFWG